MTLPTPCPIRYDVIDIQTKKVVKSCKTRNGATRTADNRDQKYGAVKHIVKPIYSRAV